jgi:glycosyltransferase involved in cell wall biosynthesis
MSKRLKGRKARTRQERAKSPEAFQLQYERACRYAEQGRRAEALRLYEELAGTVGEPRWRALLGNDRGALAALAGDYPAARRGFQEALAHDPACEVARANLELLEKDLGPAGAVAPAPPSSAPSVAVEQPCGGKVAVLSLLFNWPTTGGGNVHTAELVRFLGQSGYEVRHFFARYSPWGIGGVERSYPGEALEFDEAGWNVANICSRYRSAVDAFRPDWVVIQDAWNFKPHLAEAMRGYPCFLRFQALECLCPLNNVRLLAEGPDRFSQCPTEQLSDPAGCRACLRRRGRLSGGLHQAERALAGVGTAEYDELLRRSLREAEAVLVLNPATEALLRPHARRVCVVPWGMDPARFPRPEESETPPAERPVKRLFLAALVEEYMKGFHVFHDACSRLWQTRQDFELVATGDPPGQVDPFTRFTGWLSQAELPRLYRETDITVVPTIAQEGLSRTSVEAMASARPVVASRIGGLPASVTDGVTGLLCEPGDAEDLARKLGTLLDDAELRRRMGREGRRRFEEDFTWAAVIARHYRPLFVRRN